MLVSMYPFPKSYIDTHALICDCLGPDFTERKGLPIILFWTVMSAWGTGNISICAGDISPIVGNTNFS